MSTNVKTRFAPSPTGHLHVGGVRTALYSYLYARHTGGTFLLRIEDTDRERHVETAPEQIMEDLHWLGLEWDEGYGKGGADGPYVQSQRLDMYQGYIDKLLAAGKAYYAFETSEQLDAMREQAAAQKRSFHYARPARPLTERPEADKARAAGKPVVVRFMTPGHDVTIYDHVFGNTTIAGSEQDDFIIQKDDGFPTFHLANAVDDGLMGVTLVMRGQEFLGQSWRQSLLREAMGFPEVEYAHLPLIMDMAGQKLSKRDGAVSVDSFRSEGYLPEVLLNFLALLGWSSGGDREKFTMAELIQEFSLERLSKTNAKFDRQKLLAFNTEAMASAGEDRLLEGFKDYLRMNATPIPTGDDALLRRLIKVNHGMRTFADIPHKCGVLFVGDEEYAYDPKSVEKVLAKGGFDVLAELLPRLAAADWTEPALTAVINGYCQEKQLGMGKVAQPIRVAVTGHTISPAIYETLAILGKDKTLRRIERCLKQRK
jgi:glutamyl-tRNA synthetase